jgi:predicted dinucleotide-binding enzyme
VGVPDLVAGVARGQAGLQAGATALGQPLVGGEQQPADAVQRVAGVPAVSASSPAARVVKALNTVDADVMVRPGIVPGSHTVFVSGNDAAAKAQVVELRAGFGWGAGDIMDLGGITTARGTEIYLALWLRLWAATGAGHVNVKVVTAQTAAP